MSIYQALLDDSVSPTSIVVHTGSGVDVLPATIDLAAAEVELINTTLRELVLKDMLSHVVADYDHILIDCPPSLGLLTVNALAAANQVIIPSSANSWQRVDWRSCFARLKIQSRLNRDLQIAGILPTMYDGRTTNAHEVLTELRSSFPGQVYDVVIKHTVRLKESPAAALSILDYDRNHEVAQAYIALAEEVDRGT
jgi:chromosome partitioning protein